MKTTAKKSRFTLFFAKLPQGRIDPRARINATFDVIRDALHTKDFRLRPGEQEFEIVKHAVAHLVHKASALNNFVFWSDLVFYRNPLQGVVHEPSESKRKVMLATARRKLTENGVSFRDIVIAMDAVHVSVLSMAEQFAFGTGESFRYEGWDAEFATYMCAALLPTMDSRLRSDWERLRARILKRLPLLFDDRHVA